MGLSGGHLAGGNDLTAMSGILPVTNGGTGVTTSTGTGSVVLSAGATLTGTVLLGSTSRLGSANTSFDGGGLMYQYRGVSTAGAGLSAIYGSTLQKAEAAADANVLTITPAAAASSYRLNIVIAVSAANGATLGWTATWKDSNGSAQAPTNMPLDKVGVAAPALTFLAVAADVYAQCIPIDVDNSATAIVIKLTFSGTSFAALVSAWIERTQ